MKQLIRCQLSSHLAFIGGFIVLLLLSAVVKTAYADGTIRVTRNRNVIRITGDHKDNAISIRWTGFSLRVGPRDSTKVEYIGFGPPEDLSGCCVELYVNPQTFVIVTMKNGNDNVEFETNSSHQQDDPLFLRFFYMHMGSGNDLLTFRTEDFNIHWITATTIELNMGNGNDLLQIYTTNFRASGTLMLLGGNGKDKIEQSGFSENSRGKGMRYVGFETHVIDYSAGHMN